MQRRRLFIALAALGAGGYWWASDATLAIGDAQVAQLRRLRQEAKFTDLPGAPAAAERERFEPLLNDLLDRLIAGIRDHSNRNWVIAQMDPFVAQFYLEDSELRERCRDYLGAIFTIVGLPGPGGAFYRYMMFD